jgi:GDP-L-fucose synthase
MTLIRKDVPLFLAGHAGLIGSALRRRLASEGLDRPILAERSELDLGDPAATEAFFERHRPRWVILAAGRVGGILLNTRRPADLILENLRIQTSVLRAAARIGVERLIFFGSSCMYPRECPQPMSEELLWTGTPEPTSIAYAAAKMAGVEACLALNRQGGRTRFLPVIPNNTYGPGDDFEPDSGHVLSSLLRRIHEAKAASAPSVTLWGTGAPRREFIYAEDVADACLHLLSVELEGLKLPLNVGVGTDHSIRELAELIREVVGYPGEIRWDTTRPDGAPRKLLDSSRLLATGWRPSVVLKEGLQRTYAWYLQSLRETSA